MRDAPLPGVPARHEHPCPTCGVMIQIGDRVYARRGEWPHCSCAPGADE
jgi:hypothetical protein